MTDRAQAAGRRPQAALITATLQDRSVTVCCPSRDQLQFLNVFTANTVVALCVFCGAIILRVLYCVTENIQVTEGHK